MDRTVTKDQYGFPNDLIDPKLKEDLEYNIAFCRAAYKYWNGFAGVGGVTLKNRFATARRFAEGMQLMGGLRTRQTLQAEDGTGIAGTADIDIRPLGFANLLHRVVERSIIGDGADIEIEAIDPISQEETETLRNRIRAIRQLQPMVTEALGNVDISEGMYIPENEQVEEAYFQIGFKPSFELAAEDFLKVLNNQEKFDFRIRNKITRSLTTCNMAGTKTWFDNNGKIRKRACDVSNMVWGPSVENDFSDARFIGELIEYTIAQLKDITPSGAFSEADWQKIAKTVAGKYGNPMWTDNMATGNTWGSYLYDNMKVLVLELDWKTVDCYVYSEQKNPYNEDGISYRKKAFDYKPKENKGETKDTKEIQRWYQCSWIVETDYAYNYGAKKNQLRKVDKREIPYSSYCLVKATPEQLIASKSLNEMVQPIADMMENVWQRLQNAVSKMQLPTTWYNVRLLQNVVNQGIEGVKSIDDIIRVARQTNVGLYADTDEFSQQSGQPYYREEGGVGGIIQELIMLLEMCKQLMGDVSGINSTARAQDIDPENTKVQLEVAMLGANKAMAFVKDAYDALLEYDAEVSLAYIKRLLKEEPTVYKNALAGIKREVLAMAPDITAREFGFTIRPKLSEEKKMRLMQDVKELAMGRRASGKGGINEFTYVMMQEWIERNPKWANWLLGYHIERQRMMDDERDMRNMQLNAQAQQESNAQAIQGKQMEEQAKTDREMQKITLQGQIDERMAKIEATNDKILEMLKEQNENMRQARLFAHEKELAAKENAQTSVIV